jgi:hypothetical protein
MMRTIAAKTGILQMLALAFFFLGPCAWAQDNSSVQGRYTDEPQVAQPPDGGVNWKGVGIGAGTVVSNLVYVPAKLVYGILGGIAGGAGYALTGGNKQVANSIWRSSLGGDYVLTPDMMTGKKPIYFSGPNDAGPSQTAPAANSSSPPNSVPSGPGASLAAPAASAPAAVVNTPVTSHPIDSGAGPVGATHSLQPNPYAGATSPDGGYVGYHQPPAPKGPALRDTGVE